MAYCFTKELACSMKEADEKVREALKEKGFGVLTEINVQKTLKEKIDADFHPYVILGACNPKLAHQALQAEDQIGTMLPCNVILQEKGGKTKVSAVDPMASMQAVENASLAPIASEVQKLLKDVVDGL